MVRQVNVYADRVPPRALKPYLSIRGLLIDFGQPTTWTTTRAASNSHLSKHAVVADTRQHQCKVELTWADIRCHKVLNGRISKSKSMTVDTSGGAIGTRQGSGLQVQRHSAVSSASERVCRQQVRSGPPQRTTATTSAKKSFGLDSSFKRHPQPLK